MNSKNKNFIAKFLDQKPLLEKSKGIAEEEREKTWTSKLAGVLLSLFSALALLSINTIVQKINLNFDDVLFVRAVLQSSVGLILINIKGEPVWVTEVDQGKDINKIRLALIAFAISGAIFNLTDLIAISIMPLGDAMTIILSSSLPTMVLAAIFQKERLRLYKLLCAILVITGIVLVIRPPALFESSTDIAKHYGVNESMMLGMNCTMSDSVIIPSNLSSTRSKYYYFGVAAALICMVDSAIFRILMKTLVSNKSTNSFGLQLFCTSLANLVFALILPAVGGNQRILFPSADVAKYEMWQWVGIFVVAIISVNYAWMRVKAIRLISPTLVSFIRTLEIIIAYVIQVTILQTKPYATSLIGSGLIVIACIAVILEEFVISKCRPEIQYLF